MSVGIAMYCTFHVSFNNNNIATPSMIITRCSIKFHTDFVCLKINNGVSYFRDRNVHEFVSHGMLQAKVRRHDEGSRYANHATLILQFPLMQQPGEFYIAYGQPNRNHTDKCAIRTCTMS